MWIFMYISFVDIQMHFSSVHIHICCFLSLGIQPPHYEGAQRPHGKIHVKENKGPQPTAPVEFPRDSQSQLSGHVSGPWIMTDFQYCILSSHQQYLRILILLYILTNGCTVKCVCFSHPDWYVALSYISTYISLIINIVEHIFMSTGNLNVPFLQSTCSSFCQSST